MRLDRLIGSGWVLDSCMHAFIPSFSGIPYQAHASNIMSNIMSRCAVGILVTRTFQMATLHHPWLVFPSRHRQLTAPQPGGPGMCRWQPGAAPRPAASRGHQAQMWAVCLSHCSSAVRPCHAQYIHQHVS